MRVERGDGWVLYNADCLNVLRQLDASSIRAVITDPPYGISFKSNGQLFKSASPIAGDDSLDLAANVRRWCRQYKVPLAMFFSPYRPMAGWRNVLCWSKGAHVGIGGDRATCWKRDFELIGVENNRKLNGKRDSAVLRFNAESPPKTGHFAEKPLQLVEDLVSKLTNEGDLVVDPFCGSGTTGVAAVNLGRRFAGVEKDPRWFECSLSRIRESHSASLFEEATA